MSATVSRSRSGRVLPPLPKSLPRRRSTSRQVPVSRGPPTPRLGSVPPATTAPDVGTRRREGKTRSKRSKNSRQVSYKDSPGASGRECSTVDDREVSTAGLVALPPGTVSELRPASASYSDEPQYLHKVLVRRDKANREHHSNYGLQSSCDSREVSAQSPRVSEVASNSRRGGARSDVMQPFDESSTFGIGTSAFDSSAANSSARAHDQLHPAYYASRSAGIAYQQRALGPASRGGVSPHHRHVDANTPQSHRHPSHSHSRAQSYRPTHENGTNDYPEAYLSKADEPEPPRYSSTRRRRESLYATSLSRSATPITDDGSTPRLTHTGHDGEATLISARVRKSLARQQSPGHERHVGVEGVEVRAPLPRLQGMKQTSTNRDRATVIRFISVQPFEQRAEIMKMLGEYEGREDELCDALTEAYGEAFNEVRSFGRTDALPWHHPHESSAGGLTNGSGVPVSHNTASRQAENTVAAGTSGNSARRPTRPFSAASSSGGPMQHGNELGTDAHVPYGAAPGAVSGEASGAHGTGHLHRSPLGEPQSANAAGRGGSAAAPSPVVHSSSGVLRVPGGRGVAGVQVGGKAEPVSPPVAANLSGATPHSAARGDDAGDRVASSDLRSQVTEGLASANRTTPHGAYYNRYDDEVENYDETSLLPRNGEVLSDAGSSRSPHGLLDDIDGRNGAGGRDVAPLSLGPLRDSYRSPSSGGMLTPPVPLDLQQQSR